VISTKDLVFSYSGSPPYVLNGLNLDISKGEYISVVGENGCGKSTLMRLILGFLKPCAGTISTAAKRIGYVPQKSDLSNSSFPITVFESLNAYRKLLKIRDKNEIDLVLKQVAMGDYKKALIGTLSGGQAQKVLIARALLGNPELLILDEPSSGVDVSSQTEIYSFVKRINRENGITVVSVEHNLDAAIENSTSIYHLMNGHGHLCTPEQYSEEFLGGRRRK